MEEPSADAPRRLRRAPSVVESWSEDDRQALERAQPAASAPGTSASYDQGANNHSDKDSSDSKQAASAVVISPGSSPGQYGIFPSRGFVWAGMGQVEAREMLDSSVLHACKDWAGLRQTLHRDGYLLLRGVVDSEIVRKVPLAAS